MTTTGETTTKDTTHVDPTWAWTLAASPLLLVLVAFAFPDLDESTITLIAIGVNSGLALADWNRLDKAGVRISVFWPLLLVPVYLIMRTIRAKSTPAIPVVWFVAVMAAFVISNAVASQGDVEMDTVKLEQQLTRAIQTQYGERTQVNCPDTVTTPVDSNFPCEVKASDGTYHAYVTVTDSDGRYTWTLTQ